MKTHTHTLHFPRKSGFTLLEIAIIMVIVGLTAAGIVVGRSLLENAATMSVATDFDLYRKAALFYRDKHHELPGDHTDATSMSSSDGSCPTPTASDSIVTATCNGNGDGTVGDTTTAPLAAFTDYQESLLMWQHLSLEGSLKGQYNGRRTTAANNISIGINVPTSRIVGGSFLMRYFPTSLGTGTFYPASYNHVFFFGAPGANATLPFTEPALTPLQAYSIDQKVDDGKPGSGGVLTTPPGSSSCATSASTTEALYDTLNGDILCALIFVTGY